MLWSDYSGSIIIRCWLPDPSVLKPLLVVITEPECGVLRLSNNGATPTFNRPSAVLTVVLKLWKIACYTVMTWTCWQNQQTDTRASTTIFLKHFKLSLWYPVLQSASPETQFSIVRHTPALTLTAAVTDTFRAHITCSWSFVSGHRRGVRDHLRYCVFHLRYLCQRRSSAVDNRLYDGVVSDWLYL